MWGGNIPSTLAGEFSHSLGFALAVMFVGLLYQGVETGASVAVSPKASWPVQRR